jgi:hypothetical protein
MNYQVVFQRQGHDIETLYWAGSLEETQELARQIASRGGADAFRIVEFPGNGAEGTLERAPLPERPLTLCESWALDQPGVRFRRQIPSTSSGTTDSS